MDRDAAVALLERAPVVHLASTTPDGRPLIRTVHGVVGGDSLCFHGAPAGEKTETEGREAVVSAEEIVASIPGYFMDPERACPATTLCRSAQVHGRIERVVDVEEKARVLAALMTKYQPEGGHVPIAADHPLYRKAIEGIRVLRVGLGDLDGKAKLAQNRTPEDRVRLMEKLRERGLSGDAEAIELIRAHNPGTTIPLFLRGPADTSLAAWLDAEDAAAAGALVDGAYWNDGFTAATLARAHEASSAWVGARDATGALVATARAISDREKRAWIYDVMVAPTHREKGVGDAVMRLLLDHPALRRVRRVYLATRDAEVFYERLGVGDRRELDVRPYPPTEMVLRRA